MRNPFLSAAGVLLLFVSLFFVRDQLQGKTQNPNRWKIVFVSTRDGNKEIYTMDFDGKNHKNLTNHPAEDENPFWSPDKKKIIFESDRDGNTEIYSMNPDGTGLKNVTGNMERDDLPRLRKGASPFSPDGRKILFGSFRKKPGLYTMNADGTEPKWLTLGEEGAWSPDGGWIVYTDHVPFVPKDPYDPDVQGVVFVVKNDGTGKRRVTPVPNGKFSEADYGATFSPDGRQILFQSNRGKTSWMDKRLHIYIINTDRTGFKQLTNGSRSMEEDPRFLPDGKRIVFGSSGSEGIDGAMGVYVLDIEKKRIKRIETGIPGAGGTSFVQYIPEKKKILLSVYLRTTNKPAIFSADEDGRNAKDLTSPFPCEDPHI